MSELLGAEYRTALQSLLTLEDTKQASKELEKSRTNVSSKTS